MTTAGAPQLPGPSGDQLQPFVDDMYSMLRDLWSYGEVVAVDLGGTPTAVVYDLEIIYRILADKFEQVGRAPVFSRLAHVTGSGLLTNYHWPTWFPRRRLIVRPLGARAVGRFHQRMVAIIDEELDRWPVGEEFELHTQVKKLTLRVVADLLFTTDLNDDAMAVINRAVEAIHAWAESDPANSDLDQEPEDLQEARDALDRFINNVINGRDGDRPGDDMVGILLEAMKDEASTLDRTAVRDEAVTLILAGHETVTNTICFALDLLGRNPDQAHHDARPIVDETLRLYPPVHVTNRLALQDITVGPTTIPAGWEILIPEFVLYRSERYFERPDDFLPQRWLEGSEMVMQRRAYFPFLTGPKFCVGSHFALLEAAETIDRFRRCFDHVMLDPNRPQGRTLALSFAPDRPMPCRLQWRQEQLRRGQRARGDHP
jgi:cytochrome P450